MYVPHSAAVEELPEIVRFVKAHSFGILVSGDPLVATHVPLDLVEGPVWTVHGHVARANPHWRQLSSNPEVLTIFTGPHAYISPRWYDTPNVPTWNYTAAHLYGRARLITDREELLELVERQVALREAGSGYSARELPPEILEPSLRAIVAFTIEITRVEATYKLSRALDQNSFHNVIRELESGPDADQALAQYMRRLSPHQEK